MGVVITVGNNKGGVGKTSVACNLAVALSRHDKNLKILVVDNDSQSNATSILLGDRIDPNYTMYELLNPEEPPVPIEKCIYPTGHAGVFCLPNTEDTSILEVLLCQNISDSFHLLRDKLRAFALEKFDFTLIDNPPTIGMWLTLSLVASDFAIVPIDAGSAHSIEGLQRVLELIEHVQQSLNSDLRFLRLLVNRVDKRTLISKQILELVRTKFEDYHFETYIPLNTAIQQAEFLGRTIYEYDPSCRAARHYKKLANEVLTLLGMG